MTDAYLNEYLLAKFEDLIAQFTGLNIREREKKRLASSILLRMRLLHISDPLFYYQKLLMKDRESREEVVHLACSFANKEIYFFRDKGHFEALKHDIFPELIKENSQQKSLKIWSAGCSNGEEPYSIAMLLSSLLPDWRSWKITILGTDLCQDAIEKARKGIYGEIAFRALSMKERRHYFSQQPNGAWAVNPVFRQAVVFEQNNLFADPFPNDYFLLNHMDLIICRNVFIYFQQDAITTVVDKFSRTLNKNGYLLTGHGELQGIPTPSLKGHLLQGALVYQKTTN
jgi:chemotaxis protein methyltransferase CheR